MSFSVDLGNFSNVLEEKLKRLERSVLIGVGESVVERSPVGDPENWSVREPRDGYVGGRFRANWQYGLSVRPLGDLPDIDATGNVSKQRINAGAAAIYNAGNVHYITNNLPYAEALENGWSQQAPNGMVELTVLAWQPIVNERARLINA